LPFSPLLPDSISFDNSSKTIELDDNGLDYKIDTSANTIGDVLKENNINLGDHDQISPALETKIYPGTNIEIKRALKIKISVDGKNIDGYTLAKTVGQAVTENGITLGRLDKTVPDMETLPQDNMSIAVLRINVEEITTDEDIDFKTITATDSKMGWREKNVTTPGEKGTREVKYRVTYKNDQEISRVVLGKNIVKDPVTQVETQGTYVKTGKADNGQGTWYSYQGGLFAASLTIPHGSYARVTNTANGKSVIVQINDSGPYGKGRIIDLDKVAFQKIADIGAGVIGVKVEEVLN
jgi:uncharacterized protein YabE (DUF348 family)